MLLPLHLLGRLQVKIHSNHTSHNTQRIRHINRRDVIRLKFGPETVVLCTMLCYCIESCLTCCSCELLVLTLWCDLVTCGLISRSLAALCLSLFVATTGVGDLEGFLVRTTVISSLCTEEGEIKSLQTSKE